MIEINKYVADWFSRADEDLAVVEILLKHGGSPISRVSTLSKQPRSIAKDFLRIKRNMPEKFTTSRFF